MIEKLAKASSNVCAALRPWRYEADTDFENHKSPKKKFDSNDERCNICYMKGNGVMTNTPSKVPFVSTTIPIARPLQTLPKGSEIAIRGSIQSEPDS